MGNALEDAAQLLATGASACAIVYYYDTQEHKILPSFGYTLRSATKIETQAAGKPRKDAWRVMFTDEIFNGVEETHTLSSKTYCNTTEGETAAAGSWERAMAVLHPLHRRRRTI